LGSSYQISFYGYIKQPVPKDSNTVIRIDKQGQTKYLLYMHLYIHIPFCDGKCAYCAFYSVPYSEAKADAFLDVLAKEIEGLPSEATENFSTVYIGGGTPSVLTPDQLSRLTGLIRNRCGVADDAEWTVEGSPNTLTKDKVALLTGAGVNRISVGIQTFDDSVLTSLGRRHSSADALEILRHLTAVEGLEVGCDLIGGLPGVSHDRWLADVRTICDLGLDHASVYALSLEEGTPLMRKHRQGSLELSDEDEVIDGLNECGEMLAEAGLDRYEISNYARKGRESRHNLCYWRGGDYVGVGPGASSRIGLLRRTNTPDLDAYLREPVISRDEETVTSDEDIQERLMYHFRLTEGVDLEGFCANHSIQAEMKCDWEQRLAYLCQEGLVAQEGHRYFPTARGLDFADAICETLLS
jgi:oxygen-independent coproporphyrinogen-3 oxidase